MNDTTFMLLTIYRTQLTLNYAKWSLPQSKAVHVNDINWSPFQPNHFFLFKNTLPKQTYYSLVLKHDNKLAS